MTDSIEPNSWLRRAKKDLRSARGIARERVWEDVCYHCQQTAEKALKAYLLQRGIVPMRTHDLELLCKKCIAFDESFAGQLDVCTAMTKYATEFRYADDELDVYKSEAKQAYRDAKAIYRFCKQKIKDESSKRNR